MGTINIISPCMLEIVYICCLNMFIYSVFLRLFDKLVLLVEMTVVTWSKCHIRFFAAVKVHDAVILYIEIIILAVNITITILI